MVSSNEGITEHKTVTREQYFPIKLLKVFAKAESSKTLAKETFKQPPVMVVFANRKVLGLYCLVKRH